MKFAIATTTFWESVGFDPTHWRKNADGTKAMVHLEHAIILVPDIEHNTNIKLYDSPSEAFYTLLESEEWTWL